MFNNSWFGKLFSINILINERPVIQFACIMPSTSDIRRKKWKSYDYFLMHFLCNLHIQIQINRNGMDGFFFCVVDICVTSAYSHEIWCCHDLLRMSFAGTRKRTKEENYIRCAFQCEYHILSCFYRSLVDNNFHCGFSLPLFLLPYLPRTLHQLLWGFYMTSATHSDKRMRFLSSLLNF